MGQNQTSKIPTSDLGQRKFPESICEELRSNLLQTILLLIDNNESCSKNSVIEAFRTNENLAKTYLVNNGLPRASSINTPTNEYQNHAAVLEDLLFEQKLILPGSLLREVIIHKYDTNVSQICFEGITVSGNIHINSTNLQQHTQSFEDKSAELENDRITNSFDDLISKAEKRGHRIAHPVIKEGLTSLPFSIPIPGIIFRKCSFIDAGIIAPSVEIFGDLFFDRCIVDYVYLQGAKIQGSLIVKDCRFLRYPLMQDLIVEDTNPCNKKDIENGNDGNERNGSNSNNPFKQHLDEFKRFEPSRDGAYSPRASLSASKITVAGSVELNDSLFVCGANLDFAKIDGMVKCYGSHFQCYKYPYEIAALSMDLAEIGGSVWLAGDRDNRHNKEALRGLIQKEKNRLTASNSKIKNIRSNIWQNIQSWFHKDIHQVDDIPHANVNETWDNHHRIQKTRNDFGIDPTISNDQTDQPEISPSERDRLFCAIGGVNLRGTKIRGSLHCFCAIFIPYIYLENRDLLTKELSYVKGIADKNEFNFFGPKNHVDASIRAAGLDVGQDIKMSHDFVGLGILDFSSSRVKKNLDFRPYPWVPRIELWPSIFLRKCILVKAFLDKGEGDVFEFHDTQFSTDKEKISYHDFIIKNRKVKDITKQKYGNFTGITHLCHYLDLEDSNIIDTLRIKLDQKYFFTYQKNGAHENNKKQYRTILDRSYIQIDAPPLLPNTKDFEKFNNEFNNTNNKQVNYNYTIKNIVIDLRGAQTDAYIDDFDASDRISYCLPLYNTVPVKHNWPDTTLLHLEGFRYNRFRVDAGKDGGEDLLSYRTRDRWLRLQYTNQTSKKTNNMRHLSTGDISIFNIVNTIPVIGIICRIPMFIIQSILYIFFFIFNLCFEVPNLFGKPLNINSKDNLERNNIKTDWKPRSWQQFQPGAWKHCASVLKQSGRQADARHLELRRERYGLLDERTIPLEKLWRHSLLVLAGHSYRRRRIIYWGIFAWIIALINYQIAFESGLMAPTDPEIYASDYFLQRQISPSTLMQPNVSILAIEKLTPGLNFQLEDKWGACTKDRIAAAISIAECHKNSDIDSPSQCYSKFGNLQPPLVCLPRRTEFPRSNSISCMSNPFGCGAGIWNDVMLYLKPTEPYKPTDPPIDCLAELPINENERSYYKERAIFFAGCYQPSIYEASDTAKSIIDFFSKIPAVKNRNLKSKFDKFYLSGQTRLLAWFLMLFGWLLVGIMSASLAGILRRED